MGGGSVVPILDAKDGLDSVEKLQSAERLPQSVLGGHRDAIQRRRPKRGHPGDQSVGCDRELQNLAG